jgi:hypothetical protein
MSFKRPPQLGHWKTSWSKSIVHYLTKLGEPIDLPVRSTSRGPPYWKSTVLRRKAGA